MTEILDLGFKSDTAPLLAADAALAQLEKRAASVEAALARMAAMSSSAFAKVSPAMQAAMGPSAAGGSMVNPFGPAWTQSISGATSATMGYAAAAQTATKATGAQAAALGQAAAGHKASAGAAYANRLQMMELAHVARAMFDELAAGGNVFRALAMEGGRLQLALSTGEGGLGGLVSRLGAGFSAMLSPAVLAATAISAVGVAAAVAFGQFESGQDRLQNSLNGIGRRSGATVGQLKAIASSGVGGLSNHESLGLVAGYTSAGIGPGTSAALLGMTKDYGRVTGQGTDEAGAALAAAIRDPVKGLGDLDKSLGFVDDRMQQQVTMLERSGHLAEAQAVATEGLRKALEGTTDTTWGFKKAMEGAEGWFSNRFSQLGSAVSGAFGFDTDSAKLEKLRTAADNLQRVDPIGNADYVAQMRQQMEPLIKSVQAETDKAAAAKRDADATALSRQAGDAVRSLLPEIARANSARDTIEVLRQAMADPSIRAHMGAEGGMVGRAYSNAVVLADNADSAKRQRQDYDLRMASADAFSVGERAVVEARRAELEVLRQTGDVARAAAAAQMSMNEAIAKGNQDAEDRLQIARQEANSIGLTGLAKTIQGIRDEYQGYGGIMDRDRAASGRATDDPTIKRDLENAGGLAAKALTDTAPKIDVAGDHLAKAIEGVAAKVAAASPYGALTPMRPNDAVGPFSPTPFTGKAGGVSDHERQAVEMMVQAGYSRPAAVGFVGGLSGESGTGLDPMARNASNHRGIAQWDESRYGAMSQTGNPTDFATQMRFVIQELAGSEARAGASLRGASTVQGGLAANFLYERPSQAEIASSYGQRLANGNALGMDLIRSGRTGPKSFLDPTQDPITVNRTPIAAAASSDYRTPAPIAPNMLGKDQAAMDQRIANATQTARLGLVQGGAQQILDMNQATKLQADTFGMAADKVAALTFQQKLLGQAQRDMIQISPSMLAAIKQESDEYGAAAKARADEATREKSIIDTADTLRGGASGILSGGLLSAAHGQGFGKGASSALSSFGDTLINKGVSSLMGGLTGGPGSPFGGILGSLFSGLPHFAGGTEDAPGGPTVVGENGPELVQMPAHASVMSNGALQGLMGAARGPAPNITIGGATFIASGEGAFSDRQMGILAAQHAETQQKVADHVVRNFGQIQSDARQTG